MYTLHWTALVLVIIGAINWGLVGLFQLDLVAALFGGPMSAVSRGLYAGGSLGRHRRIHEPGASADS